MTKAPRLPALLLSIVAMTSQPWAGDATPVGDPSPTVERPYTFRFGFEPGRTIYYVIENDYADGAAISAQIPLSYSDTVIERRTYVQTMPTPTTQNSKRTPAGLVGPIRWTCDRYEVRQQGSFREDAEFDSLRHTYPVAPLRSLSKVNGSTITFLLDPDTAKPSNVRTQPGSTNAPSSPDKLSSTAQRCLVNVKNAESLLGDIGAYYFPDGPKRIGETWTLTHRSDHKSFGETVTKLDCTLRSVDEIDGSQIATIDLNGRVSLAAPPPSAPASSQGKDHVERVETTTQPAGVRGRQTARNARSRRPRETPAHRDEQHRLERATCNGTVEFDLTHGEVVRMTLHRELALAKTLSGSKPDQESVQANQTQSHTLRLRRYESPPRYPVIQGGPKPPPSPPKKATPVKPKRKPTTRKAVARRNTRQRPKLRTTNPALVPSETKKPPIKGHRPPRKAGTARPRRPTTRPAGPWRRSPTSRPAVSRNPRPTTQPARTSSAPADTTD